jgi:hypothetical protein
MESCSVSVQLASWRSRTKNLLLKTLLFVRRVRRAHVQVAQITQHAFIFFAHAPSEIRVIQMLVSRGLRHILQYTQPLLNRPLPIRRKLLPLRQDIALNVVALLGRQLTPIGSGLSHLLLLSRWQLLKVLVVLQNFLLLLPWQTVESLGRRIRRRWSIRVRIRRTAGTRILPFVLRSARLRLLPALWPLFLSLLPGRLLSRRLALLPGRLIVWPILRPIGPWSLCE